MMGGFAAIVAKMTEADRLVLFHKSSVALQAVMKSQYFDWEKQAAGLYDGVDATWENRNGEMVRFIWDAGVADQIQQYVLTHPRKCILEKTTLTPAELKALQAMFADFAFLDEATQAKLAELFATEAITSYNQAAAFALAKLGAAVEFNLVNEAIKDAILARDAFLLEATGRQYTNGLTVILDHFYENGENPLNTQFLDEIQAAMNYRTRNEAARFAMTETGSATARAQFEAYEKSGVQGKTWAHLGIGDVRPAHVALNGVSVGINETFSVNGYAAQHPRADSLPVGEVVNCHCDVDPTLGGVLPEAVWTGE